MEDNKSYWDVDPYDRKAAQLVYELKCERDKEKRRAKEAKKVAAITTAACIGLVVACGGITAYAVTKNPDIGQMISTGPVKDVIGRIQDDSTGEANHADSDQNGSDKGNEKPDKSDNGQVASDGAITGQTRAEVSSDTGVSTGQTVKKEVPENKTVQESQTGTANTGGQSATPAKENASENKDAWNKDEKSSDARVHKTKSIHYDKKIKTLSFDLDGKSYLYPVKAKTLTKKGWSMVDEAEDPNDEQMTASTLFDDDGSTLFLYQKKGETSGAKMELVLADKKSSFCGVTLKSSPKAVKKLFAKSDASKKIGFREGNGKICYSFGKYVVSVNFANGKAFSVSLEEGEIDG